MSGQRCSLSFTPYTTIFHHFSWEKNRVPHYEWNSLKMCVVIPKSEWLSPSGSNIPACTSTLSLSSLCECVGWPPVSCYLSKGNSKKKLWLTFLCTIKLCLKHIYNVFIIFIFHLVIKSWAPSSAAISVLGSRIFSWYRPEVLYI